MFLGGPEGLLAAVGDADEVGEGLADEVVERHAASCGLFLERPAQRNRHAGSNFLALALRGRTRLATLHDYGSCRLCAQSQVSDTQSLRAKLSVATQPGPVV